MDANKLADVCLADVRQHVNLTLWVRTVRDSLADETNPANRRLLAGMLVELNNRLPERKAA